jgi:4,5-DOPA dioxygenase extradiol
MTILNKDRGSFLKKRRVKFHPLKVFHEQFCPFLLLLSMNRKTFLKYSLSITAMATLGSLSGLASLPNQKGKAMPVLFIGHGSPMNGIEDNEFSRNWTKIGKDIPTPTAVLCVSAHWLTKGTFVTAMEHPKTIHDFGGFPQALFDVQYPAPGNPQLARETVDLIKETSVGLNHDWGLDHGTWTVVRRMYPDANIPVLQLSIDYHKPAQFHYNLGAELAELRKKNVLIIGSGNMVHNLRMVAWDKMDEPEFGYDWALEMDKVFKKDILASNHQALIDYEKLGEAALKAIPTPDHYFPLLYTLGLQTKLDQIEIFNDKAVAGSLTMTSVKLG